MTKNEFKYIFRGDNDNIIIPLLDERYRILQEVGKVLLNRYKGIHTRARAHAHAHTMTIKVH